MNLTLIHGQDIPKIPPKYETGGNPHCSWCTHSPGDASGGIDCHQVCTDQAMASGFKSPQSYYLVETIALITARMTK